MNPRLEATMQLWKRYALAGCFFTIYSVALLQLATNQRECERQQHQECPRNTDPPSHDTTTTPPPPEPHDSVMIYHADTHKDFLFEREQLSHVEALQTDGIPNNLIYVWCGRRWFEFHHYMSVRSAINVFKPDNVWFYYDEEPVVDSWMYNTWFKDLKDEYIFFTAIQIDSQSHPHACLDYKKPNLDFIFHVLFEKGGLYLHENTILDHYPLSSRSHHLVYGVHNLTQNVVIQSQRGIPARDLIVNPFTKDYKVRRLKCVDVAKFNAKQSAEACVVLNDDPLFPKDIWDKDTHFARLLRRHFYGTSSVPRPIASNSTLIPNIAHLIWIGGGEMDFLFFLGVVSVVYVAKVDVLYIHGDAPPTGYYWDKIKGHPKVKHIYRVPPTTVYGTKVQVISHVTDIWRVDLMLQYGGIYMDTDVAFVRPLDQHIRSYDAVATYDWTYWNHPFPDTINFGVSLGKKGARFWQLFQESMKWFVDNDWSWNGLRRPYKVQERQPQLIRIDPHLNVICFQFKCHPTWLPNYHNESYHHENVNTFTDWRSDVFAIHWTMPTPPEFTNEQELVKANSLFAQIGKYILKTAGILQGDDRTITYPNGQTIVLKVE